jgi:hypothetical protein
MFEKVVGRNPINIRTLTNVPTGGNRLNYYVDKFYFTSLSYFKLMSYVGTCKKLSARPALPRDVLDNAIVRGSPCQLLGWT